MSQSSGAKWPDPDCGELVFTMVSWYPGWRHSGGWEPL